MPMRSEKLFKSKNGKTEAELGKPKRSWSLFSKTVASPGLAPEEAFLAILIGAARADGNVSPEESQELAALTSRTRTFADLPAARINEFQKRVQEKIDREGLDKVLGAACLAILHEKDAKPDDVRMKAESVFAHAVDLAFADREFHESEREYLEDLADSLEIPVERVEQIASVIEVKNAF
jgi:tellurite resistance protein